MIAQGRISVRSAFKSLQLDAEIAPTTRKLRARQFGWWESHSSDPDIAAITTDVLREFQQRASASGLANDTVETTINAVRCVLRAAVDDGLLSAMPKRPKRLISQPTKTAKISLKEFERFIEALPDAVAKCRKRSEQWWRSLWATIYFTALRLANIQQISSRQIGSEIIEVRQLKTGKLVQIPVHPVLRRMLLPFLETNRPLKIDRKSLYRITTRACEIAGVRGISPQSIRALAARQFERAHPGAGRLILGRPFPGADAYYFDAPEILRSAVDKLAVPAPFLTKEEREKSVDSERMLLMLFRQLSRDDQATLMSVACGLKK